MTTIHPKPPARRWPWVIAVVVVAAAALILALVFVKAPAPGSTRSTSTPAVTPSVPVPAQTLMVTPDPVADAAPTGCLGGPERNADMVLATVEKAPHTSNGAVEVAASLVRWISQSAIPSGDDVQRIQEAVLASGSAIDLEGAMVPGADMSNGSIPAGTPFYLSTAPGVWDVESSGESTVTVAIGTGFVVNGALSPTQRGSATMTMQWENDHWTLLSSGGSRTPADLFASGTAFTGGC